MENSWLTNIKAFIGGEVALSYYHSGKNAVTIYLTDCLTIALRLLENSTHYESMGGEYPVRHLPHN